LEALAREVEIDQRWILFASKSVLYRSDQVRGWKLLDVGLSEVVGHGIVVHVGHADGRHESVF
jgi:hypothetical protein